MTESQNKSGNRRRFTQRRGRGSNSNWNKSNTNSSGSQLKNNNKPKERELKFHLHDSTQRKTSESYNKIVEAIITKMQKTFDDLIDIVNSLETKTKKVFTEPTAADAATSGTDAQKARKDRLAEKKWEILFNHYQDKVETFDSLWVKTYALIWDNYCSKEVQIALQEMPNFDSTIKREPLVLLEKVEQLT